MKKNIISFFVLLVLSAFTSCETNTIDGAQYIQGPGDCIKSKNVTWNGAGVSLHRVCDEGSYIEFRAQMKGALYLEYMLIETEHWGCGGFQIYVGGQQVGNYVSGSINQYSQCQVNNIKKGQVIKIVSKDDGLIFPEQISVSLLNIKIIGENANPNPDWDF